MVKTIEAIRHIALHSFGGRPRTHARSSSLAKFWKDRGMLFLSCGNELAFLHERASEVARELKD